jgi:hypothetical protein
MIALWQAMQECGWAAYAVLLVSVVAFGVALAALAMAAARARFAPAVAAVVLALALLAASIGPVGTFSQRRMVEGAVSGEAIDPAMRARILAVGYAEAAQCTNLGLGFGALPLVLAAGALAFAFARRQPQLPAGSGTSACCTMRGSSTVSASASYQESIWRRVSTGVAVHPQGRGPDRIARRVRRHRADDGRLAGRRRRLAGGARLAAATLVRTVGVARAGAGLSAEGVATLERRLEQRKTQGWSNDANNLIRGAGS